MERSLVCMFNVLVFSIQEVPGSSSGQETCQVFSCFPSVHPSTY